MKKIVLVLLTVFLTSCEISLPEYIKMNDTLSPKFEKNSIDTFGTVVDTIKSDSVTRY